MAPLAPAPTTPSALAVPQVAPSGPGLPVLVGCVGLGGAVLLRVGVAGADGASSTSAGMVFAIALTALALMLGVRFGRPRARGVAIGLVGALILCLGPLLAGGGHPVGSLERFPTWAVIVSGVAIAEEVLLRGALFDAVRTWRSEHVAVLVTAVAFALLHVPVYGWHVVPLDLAVGLGLGALRLLTGGITAPAVAHVGADLAGWWLQ